MKSAVRLRALAFITILLLVPMVLRQSAFSSKKEVGINKLKKAEQRFELLAGLDLFVRAQRVFWSLKGSYVSSHGRIPNVLGALVFFYKIDIPRADRNSLVVTALEDPSISRELLLDRVAVNQNFEVQANFSLPVPPKEYLETLAQSVMRKISTKNMKIPELEELRLLEGIYQGYFLYEVREDSKGTKIVTARGRQAPVEGLELIYDETVAGDLYAFVLQKRKTQWLEQEVREKLDTVYTAQKIYFDHHNKFSEKFSYLIPYAENLSLFDENFNWAKVQHFSRDTALGFHAELAVEKGYGLGRVWSINGYGQLSELASVEQLVDRLQPAKRDVAGEESLKKITDDDMSDGKKLLIDAIPQDK